jgi:imidazolonepropionase
VHRADLLVADLDQLLTMDPRAGEGPLGVIEGGAVAFAGGEVCYVGPTAGCPDAARVVDGRGRIGLPGLVDCHTHSLFAGSRAEEFGLRLAGVHYSEILERGGGILSTVAATRAASDEALTASLEARLAGFAALGVTTVEVKTGYALSTEQELRCLDLLAGREGVVPTFLGAHAVPPEWRGDRAGYVALILAEMVAPAAARGAHIDVYCDRGAFTLEETRSVLEAGLAAGMVGHLHAEQVAFTGAAALAAELGCASAEHLERVDAAGIAAMAAAGTIGVMLPGARAYLRDTAPPARAMIDAGVRLAVATDFNPGSSPVRDLWSCATLACLDFGLTVEEALLGVTRHAGLALARPELGWLGAGSAADFAMLRPPPGEPARYQVLVQYLGGHRADLVVRGGRALLEA